MARARREPEGRKVREFNQDADDQISQARKAAYDLLTANEALYDVLWNRDPVEVGRALGKSLKAQGAALKTLLGALDKAREATAEIERITEAAAGRDSHNGKVEEMA